MSYMPPTPQKINEIRKEDGLTVQQSADVVFMLKYLQHWELVPDHIHLFTIRFGNNLEYESNMVFTTLLAAHTYVNNKLPNKVDDDIRGHLTKSNFKVISTNDINF